MSLFPQRPGNGTVGRCITLRANFFSLNTLPTAIIHHYTVEILPEVPPARNRRIYQIWEDASREHGALQGICPVFDGRTNIFSPKPLPFEGQSAIFDIDYYDEDEFITSGHTTTPPIKKGIAKRFTMTVTKSAHINMQRLNAFLDGLVSDTPHDAIQVLDVLLRHCPSLQFTTVGRCFYTLDSATGIANGVQLWQGFHQSLIPSRGRMLLNIDVSATAFYQPVDKDRSRLEKSLKGIKIVIKHRGPVRRKYCIVCFTSTPASRTTFSKNNTGVEQTVAEYFLENHLRKLNERQTADMIKFTCQPPHVRSNKISAGVTLLQQHDNDYLRDFVWKSTMKWHCNSSCTGSTTVSYHPASKELLLLRAKVHGIYVIKWWRKELLFDPVLLYLAPLDYPAAVQKFITLLVQTCEECGVFVPNKHPPISYANVFGDIERIMIDAYMVAGDSYQERPQLIACILPNTGVPLMQKSSVSDTVIGVATQCLQAKHMFAAKRQYCANVCLKLNVKLAKPERIVYYRDGVSETQFNVVLRCEIDSIRRACAELDPEYRPTVTFVIVQKRHHARFFPIHPEDADRSGNVLPGTVVDVGVTHPSEFDLHVFAPGLQDFKADSLPYSMHLVRRSFTWLIQWAVLYQQEFTHRTVGPGGSAVLTSGATMDTTVASAVRTITYSTVKAELANVMYLCDSSNIGLLYVVDI
ncbi:hypothetical protein BSLG_006906 [Batrachochytrium salamandrivorans]|nr:hypothetical protein BSLG_006906 [Batrachochytrium salamandrivorans]